MKIAFVHDWLLGMRGGEKVLENALELFPEADIYTLLHDPARVSETLNRRVAGTSLLELLPRVHSYYRYLLPSMPGAVERLELRGYDLVLSSSHCVAKGVRPRPGPDGRRPVHVCYCHTPMRYIYYQFDNYLAGGARPWVKRAMEVFRPYLIRWDQESARGVDHFIANSENVRRRIQASYGRDAEVIYPPVDTEFYDLPAGRPAAGEEPFYLVAGALVPYKRVDLAIEACHRLGARLKVVGEGTEEKRLKALARDARVEFLGRRGPEDLRRLYQGCEALLFPQEEDFGIAAVEAMACGRPVVAYGAGGALESVVPGVTGILCDRQTPESLAEGMARARTTRFDPRAIREHARKFDRSIFKRRLQETLASASKDRGNRQPVSRRLRVVEVIECGGSGGTGYQVAALCNGLDRSRFEVHLAYSVRPPSPPDEYRASARGAMAFHYIPQMVREIRPLKDLTAWIKLYHLFRRLRPDIVHAHSSKAGFLARIAAWAAGVERVFYSPRGYSFLQTDRSALSRLLYRWLERTVSWIGTVAAVSESEAALARGTAWARSVRVIPDAYLDMPEAQEPRARDDSAPLRVYASGRMSYPRHPQAFVRLARGLADRGVQARCAWVGGGELEAEVRAMARERDLNGRLEVTGWLSHAEALQRVREADVFVHFSRWEGLPNTVLEAMALGKPVVASDIPANRELVRDGENGFLAADEQELLDRTARLLGDPALRSAMGERGQALAREKYSRERLLEQVSELYAGG